MSILTKQLSTMVRIINRIKIIDILLFIWMGVLLIPQAVLIPGFNYIWLFCQSVWLVVILSNYRYFSYKEKQFFIWYIICYSFIALECIVLDRTEILRNYVDLLQVPFMFLIACYYHRKRGLGVLRKVIVSLLPLFIFVALTTGIAVINDPYAARAVYVSGDNVTQESLLLGVGGYNFIYAIMLFAIVLFCFAICAKKEYWLRLICIILCVFFSAIVLLSNFFTATVILFICFMFFLVARKKERLAPLVVILVLVLPTYKIWGGLILDGASMIVQEEGRTYERLQDLKFSLEHNTKVSSEVNTREDVKDKSVKAFLNNPILGAITDSRMSMGKSRVVGNHSIVLDSLAIFGIFLGSLFVLLLIMPFVYCIKGATTHIQKMYCLTNLIAFGLFIYNNNIGAAAGFVSLCVFPYTYYYLKEEQLFPDK